MKKVLTLMLALAMIAMLVVPAFAAEEDISISDMNVKPGDTAYLRITLKKSLVGDSIGITYSYDTAVLKAVPKSCTWEKKGAIQDFNNKKAGAWAASSAMDLKGDLCVLAFQVPENASFTETQVTCTVIIKKGTETVGEYTVTGTISMTCEHKFGEWADEGSVGHAQICELCGKKTTASHAWDEGTIVHNPEDEHTDLKVYTCTVCGAQKQENVPAEKEDHSPVPTERPTEAQTEPTAPPVTMPIPETRPTEPLETFPNPNHPQETEPQYDPEPEVEHDHNNQQGNTQNPNHQDDKTDKDDNKQNGSQNGSQNNQNPSSSGNQQSQNNQNPNGSGNQQSQNNQNPNGSGSQQNQNNQNDQDKQQQETVPPSYVDYNNPVTNTEAAGEPGQEGHYHSNGEYHDPQATVPMVVPGNGIIETEEPTESHDHVHEEEEPSGGIGTAIIAVVLLALMIGLPVYIIRNKKKI